MKEEFPRLLPIWMDLVNEEGPFLYVFNKALHFSSPLVQIGVTFSWIVGQFRLTRAWQCTDILDYNFGWSVFMQRRLKYLSGCENQLMYDSFTNNLFWSKSSSPEDHPFLRQLVDYLVRKLRTYVNRLVRGLRLYKEKEKNRNTKSITRRPQSCDQSPEILLTWI